MQPISYARHQFPAEIIRHTVGLYLRFTLSYRDVEELLAERGIATSYATVRRWVLKFGPAFARNLRRLRPRPTRKWQLDEMVISIQGKRMYLWRAVDSEGEVLDLLVQSKRDTKAALRLMRKLLKKQGYAPDQLVTDKRGPMARPDESCVSRATTSRASARTIGRKTLISRCDGESGRCSASNRRDQPSASSRSMLQSTTRSPCSATSSPAARSGPSGPRRCKLGTTRLLRRERDLTSTILRLRSVPVTVPTMSGRASMPTDIVSCSSPRSQLDARPALARPPPTTPTFKSFSFFLHLFGKGVIGSSSSSPYLDDHLRWATPGMRTTR